MRKDTVIEDVNRICNGVRAFQIVRHSDGCNSELLVEVNDEFVDFPRRDGIEPGGRFVV